MVDAVRPRFSIAAFVAQTKAAAAAHPGIPITPRTSTTQTAADRATLKSDYEVAFRQISEARSLARSSRTSRTEDVSTMRPDQAEARLTQLQVLRKLGGIEHMGVDAAKGDQRTASLDTFMEWLAERAGQNGDIKTSAAPSPLARLVDVKV